MTNPGTTPPERTDTSQPVPEQPDDWTEPGAYPVAAGVHRIPLPMPHDGLRAVNLYLIEAEEGLLAIDSGWAIPETTQHLTSALARLGHTPRRSAVKARTQATNQLRSLLVHVDDDLRQRLTHRRTLRMVERTSRIRPTGGTKRAMRSLARRWLLLTEEIGELERALGELVQNHVPELLERPGIGVISAAQLLVTAGANPDRLHCEGAFAALCGATPVRASSGQTIRHRLNRGGDRQANHALWTIARVRLVHDERTRAYAARRTTLGDSRKETLRRLKRYVAREVYPIILRALGPHARPR